MAKNDNLTDFVTDIADAIREKKGTTDKINPQDFSAEIANLPSGGETKYEFGETMMDNNGKGISSMQTLVFLNGVKSIDSYAFQYCSNLKTIQFAETLESIGDYAFLHCSSIESISLPSSLVSLGRSAFANNLALQSFDIAIDAPLTTIPYNMLWKSTLLKKIVIPQNVNSIDPYAFETCSGLQYIDFSHVLAIPTLINVSAFSGTTCDIVVPDVLYEQWIISTNWSSLTDRIVKNSQYTRPL